MRGMRAGLAIICLAVWVNAAGDTLEDAKREGEVVWYTSMNVSDADAVLKPFRERRTRVAQHFLAEAFRQPATRRHALETVL